MFSLTNKSLIRIAIISVFSSVLITLFLLFNPFNDYDPLYVSGKTLYIKSYEPLIVKEYGYMDFDNSQKKLLLQNQIKRDYVLDARVSLKIRRRPLAFNKR